VDRWGGEIVLLWEFGAAFHPPLPFSSEQRLKVHEKQKLLGKSETNLIDEQIEALEERAAIGHRVAEHLQPNVESQ
jgi:hypothetical protein